MKGATVFMWKKIPALIVALLASISLSSVQALSASATTTTDATISSTDFVVPGGTNTSTINFTVNVGTGELTSLYIIASDNVSFTGIGTSDSVLDFSTTSTNTVADAGVTLSFPNGGVHGQLDFKGRPNGFTNFSQSNTFEISPVSYPDQGSQIDLSLAPGSIAFGSSGPWKIKVLAYYDIDTSLPPLDSEFQTFTLTEPSAPTPTPANTAVSNDLANTGIDSVPTQNLALFSIGAGVLVLLFAKYRSVTAARNSRRIFKNSR